MVIRSVSTLHKSVPLLAVLMLVPAGVQAAGYFLFPTTSSVARLLAGNGLLEREAGGLLFNAASPGVQAEQSQLEIGVSRVAHELSMQDQGSQTRLMVNGNMIANPIPGADGRVDNSAIIPGFSYTAHSSSLPWLSWGAAVSAPYGLDTEYNTQWTGRYQALLSSLEIVELDLVVAARLGPRWVLGGGLSVQHGKVELTQAVPLSPVQDGLLGIEGDSNKQGVNVGLIYQHNPALTLGLNFRSRVAHDFDATQKVLLADSVLSQSTVQAPFTVPETLLFSAHFAPAAAPWGLSGALRHTRWERFDELALYYPDNTSKKLPQLWQNNLTWSAAFDYRIREKQQVVISFSAEQSPVRDASLRNARLPDDNRKIVGLGYEVSEAFCRNCSLQLAYHRTMSGSRLINREEEFRPGFSNVLKGKYESSTADVLAFSFTVSLP